MNSNDTDGFLGVVEASVDPMLIADAVGRILYANPACTNLFGYAHEVMPTLTIGDLIPEHLRECHAAHLAEFRGAPRSRPMGAHLGHPLYGRRADGTLVPTEISLSPLGDGRVLAAVHDISQRVQAEEAMRRCSARYAGLLGAIPDIVVELDAEHVLRWGNDAARCFFGEQMAGTAIGRFQASPEHSFPRTTDGAVHEVWFVRGDGDQRLLAWSCRDVGEVSGEPGGLICTARDVTERHRDEQSLRELRAQMRQFHALHVAGQTLRKISHELNQPLDALCAYAAAALKLLEGPDLRVAQLRAAVEGCCDEADRAGQVARALSSFMHRDVIPLAPIDLVRAADNAVRLCRDDGIDCPDITIDIAPDLWAAIGNQQQIESVLHNLLRNSIEALRLAGQSTPSVRIEARNDARRSGIQVTFSDNGPGIDQASQTNAFTPFYTTRQMGVGLGLTISRALIEASGGELWYDGEAAPGATFRFTLPAESGT